MTPPRPGSDGGAARIVVSGASSYLGQRLLEHLAEIGASVATVTRRPFDLDRSPTVRGSIDRTICSSDDDLIERVIDFAPTGIVHMAASGGLSAGPERLRQLLEATVVLGVDLLEAASRSGGRTSFVAIGSFSEREQIDGVVIPASLYSATKSALYPYLLYFFHQRGVRSAVLQPTDIYGTDDWRRRLLDLIVDAAQTGEPLAVTAGEQEVSFVHVDDVCRAIIATLELIADPETAPNTVETYTVSGPERGRLIEQIEAALSDLSIDVPLRWGDRPYRDGEVFSPEFAPAIPGFTPEIGLVEGLASLLDRAR